MEDDFVCCVLPNQTITQLNQLEAQLFNCSRFKTDLELYSQLVRWNASDEDIDHWYGECFGPRDPPSITLEELLPPLLVYGMTFLLGVAGNILILFAVLRRKSMKNPTNTFLASLASADLLLILLCLPVKLYKLFTFTWQFGGTICKGIYYIQDVSAICSVLNLTAMSLERFYAIVYPLKAKSVCTTTQARKVVCSTWALSFTLALPRNWIQVQVEVGNDIDGYSFWCVPHWSNTKHWLWFQIYMLTLVLILPTIVMSVAYTSISIQVVKGLRQRRGFVPERRNLPQLNTNIDRGRPSLEDELMIPLQVRSNSTPARRSLSRSVSRIRSSKSSGSLFLRSRRGSSVLDQRTRMENGSLVRNSSVQSQGGRINSNPHVRKVVRMLVLVVLVFILCWSPLLIYDLLQAFGSIPIHPFGYHKHIKTVFSLLAYFNSCINPVIYGFMSKTFRMSFLETFKEWTQGCNSGGSERNSRNSRNSERRSGDGRMGENKCTCDDPFSICKLHTVQRDLRGILEVDEARIEELNNLHQERFLLDPSRRINPSLQLWNLENSEVSIYPFHTIWRHNMDSSNKAQDILSLREEFKAKMDSNSQTEYQTASQEHNGGLSETNSKPDIKSQSPNKNQAHVEKQRNSFHSQNESQAVEESQTYLESQADNEFQSQSNSQAVNKSQTYLKSQADNGFQPQIESHHKEESQEYLESQADNEFQPHINSQAVEKSLTYIESQADNGFQPQIESHHEEESQKYLESQADNEFQLQTKSQRDSESQESQEIDGLRTENKSQLDKNSQEINEVQSTHKSQQENGVQTKNGVHSQNNSNPHNCFQKQNAEELLHNDQGFVHNEKDLPHLYEKDLKPNVENFLHLGKLKSTVEVNGLSSELDTGIKLKSEPGDTTNP